MTIPSAFKFNNTITNNNVAIDDAMTSALTAPIDLNLTTALNNFITQYLTASGGSSVLKVLTGDTNFYVSTTGSDTNNGLTSLTAWKTIQHALNTVGTYLLNGFNATINVADGTYNENLSLSKPFIGGTPNLIGNISTPANCIITGSGLLTLSLTNYSALNIGGFNIVGDGTTNASVTVLVRGAALNIVNPVIFSMANYTVGSSFHTRCDNNGAITYAANVSISGNSAIAFLTQLGGAQLFITGITVTYIGTPSFSTADFVVSAANVVMQGGVTITGAATGARYAITLNGTINSNGQGSSTTYFPGNSAGTLATGGQQS